MTAHTASAAAATSVGGRPLRTAVQERGRGGHGQDAGGGVRGAAQPGIGVVAGLERGGGPAERGHRVTAAGVAEQRVERHPGGQAYGEWPCPRGEVGAGGWAGESGGGSRAGHHAIVPGA